MTKGVFLTDREIFDKKLWQNILDFRLFFFLYGNAIWKEEGAMIDGVHVGRGQFLRSLRKLQDDLEYIENNRKIKPPLPSLRRSIRRLELDGRLSIKVTELGTLFTIINYRHYQGFERFQQGELDTGLDTGLAQAVPKKKKEIKVKNNGIYKAVIDYLNQTCGTSFRVSPTHTKHINARLAEGYTLDDFKTVIGKKSTEWLGTDQAKYLRPSTLFGSKFDNYLNQLGGGKSCGGKRTGPGIQANFKQGFGHRPSEVDWGAEPDHL